MSTDKILRKVHCSNKNKKSRILQNDRQYHQTIKFSI